MGSLQSMYAEGNQISVDSGQTAQYVYDAFNRRVWIHTNGNSSEQEPAYQEIDYDLNGKRLSIWDGSSGNLQKVQLYWGSQPVAFYTPGAIHFQHQDWLGSERVTTSYNGAAESTIGHYPFGEVKSSSGNQIDAYQFGQLDHTDANTEHAQFREYENGQGHWLAPDPYDGSYDPTNPQSFNRYAYVLNNPVASVDPAGLTTIVCQVNPTYHWTDGYTDVSSYDGTGFSSSQSIDVNGNDPSVTCRSVGNPDPQATPSGNSGNNTGAGGAPSSLSLGHIAACTVGAMSVLGASEALGKTVGIGVGGSIGIGLGFGGGYLSFGVQLVGDPNGGLGVATSFGFSNTALGAGAQIGGQLSVSRSPTIGGLTGASSDYGGSYGIVGADFTTGAGATGTLTVGPAPGLKAGAAMSTQLTRVYHCKQVVVICFRITDSEGSRWIEYLYIA